MELINQVTCKELSQKMCELGFKQESFFYWWNGKVEWVHPNKRRYAKSTKIAAFTVAELGEMLPYKIKDWYLEIVKEKKNVFYVAYSGGKWGFEVMGNKCFRDKSEADARAKMLIWLKENGYLK